MSVFHYVREHPLLTGGIVVGAVAAYLIVSRAGGGQAGASGLDPVAAQLTAQTNQLQAAGQSQAEQDATNLQLARVSAQYGLDLAALQGTRDITLSNTAASVEGSRIASDTALGEKSIAAQLAGLETQANLTAKGLDTQLQIVSAQIGVTRDIARITADETTAIANLSAQRDIAVSNNQTQVALAQTGAAASVAINTANTAASVARNASDNALTGSLFQSAAGFALALI